MSTSEHVVEVQVEVVDVSPKFVTEQWTWQLVMVVLEAQLLVGSELWGFGDTGGPSMIGGGPDASGHSPATWIPNIPMQGKWKAGSSGRSGHSEFT